MAVERMHSDQQFVVDEPDAELAAILDQADSHVVIVERNGARYRVERESGDVWAGYDPERVREGLRQSAGAFKDIDVEAFRRDLRFWRGHDDDEHEDAE